MNITVIAIGKLKEKYWQEAVSEYMKRLRNYCSFEIIEIRESLFVPTHRQLKKKPLRQQKDMKFSPE